MLSPRVEWRQDNFLAILTSAPIFNLNIPTGKLENWGPKVKCLALWRVGEGAGWLG